MTIREIAALAGVSPASVSLVINDKKGVSEETRQKVLEVIRQHNYPVTSKRRRAQRPRVMLLKFHNHGFAEENQGFIAAIIDRIERECHRCGLELVNARCDAADARNTLPVQMSDPPDGVLLVGTELLPEHYPLLDLIPAPTVVLDNDLHYGGVDSVTMANEAIAADAVDYLYRLGHRDIGYIQFNLPVHNCQQRYKGYLQRMAALGLPVPEPCVVGPTMNTAYESMKRIIAENRFRPHTALLADNDSVAIGACKAFLEAGYHIPGDFSLIGVDDIPFSAVSIPALTTMRVSRSTLGTLAVELLRARLKNPSWPPVHLQIDGHLVERKSCAAGGRAE